MARNRGQSGRTAAGGCEIIFATHTSTQRSLSPGYSRVAQREPRVRICLPPAGSLPNLTFRRGLRRLVSDRRTSATVARAGRLSARWISSTFDVGHGPSASCWDREFADSPLEGADSNSRSRGRCPASSPFSMQVSIEKGLHPNMCIHGRRGVVGQGSGSCLEGAVPH